MKKIIVSVLLLSILLVVGASAAPFGLFYTDVKEPVAASSLPSYSKTAQSGNFSVLGLFALGDSSAEKIAKNAGITKIKHIDKHTFSILSIFISETFTVYGD